MWNVMRCDQLAAFVTYSKRDHCSRQTFLLPILTSSEAQELVGFSVDGVGRRQAMKLLRSRACLFDFYHCNPSNMPKRTRDDAAEDASSQATATETRSSKKTRLTGAAPASPAKVAIPAADISKTKRSKRTTNKKAIVLPPSKRPLIPGRLNRLAVPKPQSLAARKSGSGSTRPDVNRRGNKINKGWGTGGFDSAPTDTAVGEDIGQVAASGNDRKGRNGSKNSTPVGAEMWITRKSSYAAYLKSGVSAFMEKGWVASSRALA